MKCKQMNKPYLCKNQHFTRKKDTMIKDSEMKVFDIGQI